ncbi:heptaprenyl diphosphate synthase [Pilibacter termitis]|uniref:Heptaprenyl diphosphate synthase n=1 Tax=Pilibacter termitis TaxID=263852 RepID=A0A1T4NBU5_9ENTE|nr:Gx transporter family protein [Pilibacter termitis]SJZ76563.1 heptaprenyl diphosphate synthase [Pilibacter termitis]
MKSTKKMTYIALLTALAVVIGLAENVFPPPFPFAPGAKLGLANLITVLALFTMKKREVAFFLTLRLLLQMLLGGTASTFLYSLSGAILSCLAMYLVKMLGARKVSIIGISSVGGFFHNVGQLAVACMIAGTPAIMNYLPVLSIFGILAGFFIGIAGNYLLANIQTLRNAHLVMQENGKSTWLEQISHRNGE